MPIWSTGPVSEQPELTLTRWRIFELANGDRHFCGFAIENSEGRASSRVAAFDASLLRGITESGRVYQLSGPSNYDSDADYVWQAWARINEATEWTDRSADVWASHLAALEAGPTLPPAAPSAEHRVVMTAKRRRAWLADSKVRAHARQVLGERNASLLYAYGKLMTGPPDGGLYVSGIGPQKARTLIDALARGDEIAVHLMHRHRSGNYESSSLRLQDGKLIMRFDDREELA